jgi:integrase
MAERRTRARTFGTVRQLPSGRWQVRYHDQAGSRHTAPTTFLTKADANVYLAMVEADMRRGAWIDPRLSRTTFAQWAERWWQTTSPTLRPKTQVNYRWVLDAYLLPAFGATPLGAIDTLTVRGWLAELHSAGRPGQATIAKAYRILRRIFAAAVEAGYLLRTPCTVKGAGSEQRAELRVPTVAEITKLADIIDQRYRAMVLVAAYGALRWGELVGLRRQYVDLRQATVQVVQQVTEIKGRLHSGPPKSDAGRRTVTLPRFVVRELAEHLHRFAEPDPTGLVFPAPHGGYLRSSNFHREVWTPARAAAGLPGIRFHDLRHAAATFAAQTGATTKELMVRIGHATPAAALRHQHAPAERDRAIAAKLERLGRPAKGTFRARTAREQLPRATESSGEDVP